MAHNGKLPPTGRRATPHPGVSGRSQSAALLPLWGSQASRALGRCALAVPLVFDADIRRLRDNIGRPLKRGFAERWEGMGMTPEPGGVVASQRVGVSAGHRELPDRSGESATKSRSTRPSATPTGWPGAPPPAPQLPGRLGGDHAVTVTAVSLPGLAARAGWLRFRVALGEWGGLAFPRPVGLLQHSSARGSARPGLLPPPAAQRPRLAARRPQPPSPRPTPPTRADPGAVLNAGWTAPITRASTRHHNYTTRPRRWWIPLSKYLWSCLSAVVQRTKEVWMAPRFNAPPGWPASPPGWSPPSGWEPERSWPPAPPGWQWWIIDEPTLAGWFADPCSGATLGRLRWWNGTEWTNHVHDGGYSAPPRKARPTPLPGAALSTTAIVALVVSIIGLAMVLSGFNWSDTVGGGPLGAPGRGDLFGFGAAVRSLVVSSGSTASYGSSALRLDCGGTDSPRLRSSWAHLGLGCVFSWDWAPPLGEVRPKRRLRTAVAGAGTSSAKDATRRAQGTVQ